MRDNPPKAKFRIKDYPSNVKWLMYLEPFRNLSLSAAYLTPFFLQNGLSLWRIMLLQTIFSVACVLWEIPSGLIADRFGRAYCIKVSAVIACLGQTAYGFSHRYWQFVVWEIVLAVANGLISGVDTALLIDTLKSVGKEKQYVRISQRIDAFGWSATGFGVPVATLLVLFVSVRSTLIADGLLTGAGAVFAFKLTEVRHYVDNEEEAQASVWCALKQLGRKIEVRWLIVLGATLSTATYLSFWFSAPYYTKLGIPLGWFSFILAVRSLWKAYLSHKFAQERHLERNMISYALLAGLVYAGMATGTIWLVWVVLGHDIVQALSGQPITDKLNVHIAHKYRATMNSVVNLIQRLVYSAAGPLLGLLVDRAGLGKAFVIAGTVVGLVAITVIARLHTLKTFQEGR